MNKLELEKLKEKDYFLYCVFTEGRYIFDGCGYIIRKQDGTPVKLIFDKKYSHVTQFNLYANNRVESRTVPVLQKWYEKIYE